VSISGELFTDSNGNGRLDSGDTGIANTVIELIHGATTTTVTSNASGNYTFTGVGPGTYTIQNVLPTGWIQDTSNQVTTSSGSNVSGVNIGNFQLGTISGRQYTDHTGTDATAGITAEDTPRSGVTIDLIQSGGGTTTATTDSNGNYSFTNLAPGSYTVKEALPTGWTQTFGAAGYSFSPLLSGTSSSTNYFADFQKVSISGELFVDTNGSGTLVSSDSPIKNTQILLTGGGTTLTMTSDSNGNYTFTGVGPGTYTLQNTLPTGWVQDTASQVTTNSGVNVSGDNIGNFQTVSVSGTVFQDLNDQHTLESGDPGIANVVIDLNGQAAATTNANGNYTIANVGPGSYTVSEVVPTSEFQTFPYGDAYSITTSSGSNVVNQNFSNETVTISKANGQSGYSETGTGWQTVQSGWNGNSYSHAKDASGTTTATWTLSVKGGIPKGSYEVFVSYVSSGAASGSTVPYTIEDGTSIVATPTVNQQQPAFGATYQGVAWQSLGIHAFTSGTATVIVNANTNGSISVNGVVLIAAGAAQYLETDTAGGQATPASQHPPADLTLSQLQPVVQEAKALWVATGLAAGEKAALNSAQFYITPLSGGLLGLTAGEDVWLDPTAEGQGWFVGAQPVDAAAFAPSTNGQWQAFAGSPAYGKVDLLTVMAHELGHVLGLPDVPNASNPGNLMDDSLAPGIRRLPTPSASASRLPAWQVSLANTALGHASALGQLPAASGVNNAVLALMAGTSPVASVPVQDQVFSAPATLVGDSSWQNRLMPDLETIIDNTALARVLNGSPSLPALLAAALDPADAANGGPTDDWLDLLAQSLAGGNTHS
jgi:protocatechuate 3,4-dioxygenase beta subunit